MYQTVSLVSYGRTPGLFQLGAIINKAAMNIVLFKLIGVTMVNEIT